MNSKAKFQHAQLSRLLLVQQRKQEEALSDDQKAAELPAIQLAIAETLRRLEALEQQK